MNSLWIMMVVIFTFFFLKHLTSSNNIRMKYLEDDNKKNKKNETVENVPYSSLPSKTFKPLFE